MRKKLEELRKKEEGFTLVELLAVIVILGIIVAIAIPAIGSIMDGAQDDADEAEEQLIIDAARLYEVENDLPVTTQTLESEGYLEPRGGDAPQGTVSRGDDGLEFNADGGSEGE